MLQLIRMSNTREMIVPIDPSPLESYEDQVRSIQDRIADIFIDPPAGGKIVNKIQHEVTLGNQKRFLSNILMFFGNIPRARRATGISYNVQMRWLKSKRLKELYDEIVEGFVDVAEEQLHRHVRMGSLDAAKFVLKTKGRNRGYGNKLEVEVKEGDFAERMLKAKERVKQNRLAAASNIVKEVTDGK